VHTIIAITRRDHEFSSLPLGGPYTFTRAILSDAVTLIRGDRFYTLDFTAKNLTSWGMDVVSPDYDELGGSKMSTLILTAFPNFFEKGSVYAMQPFYTPKESKNIFTKVGTADKYSFDPPKYRGVPRPVGSFAGVSSVLQDTVNFGTHTQSAMKELMRGKNLIVKHEDIAQALYSHPEFEKAASEYCETTLRKILKRESYTLGKDKKYYQVDIIREYDIPSPFCCNRLTICSICNVFALQTACAIFGIPLETETEEKELWKIISDAQTYIFFDLDPTKSWALRRDATTGVETLAKKFLHIISAMEGHQGLSMCKGISNLLYPAKEDVGLGKSFIKSLYHQGKSAEEITWTIIMLLCNTVGNSAHGVSFSITHHKRESNKTQLGRIIDFYLAPENRDHWADIQALARSESSPESNEQLLRYSLEAHRLNQPVTIIRQASCDSLVGNASQGEYYHLDAGDYVSCDIVSFRVPVLSNS
jgi:hypothetical protein